MVLPTSRVFSIFGVILYVIVSRLFYCSRFYHICKLIILQVALKIFPGKRGEIFLCVCRKFEGNCWAMNLKVIYGNFGWRNWKTYFMHIWFLLEKTPNFKKKNVWIRVRTEEISLIQNKLLFSWFQLCS